MKKIYLILIAVSIAAAANAQIGEWAVGDASNQTGRMRFHGASNATGILLSSTAAADALVVGSGAMTGSGVLPGFDVACGTSCYIGLSDGSGTIYMGAAGAGNYSLRTFTANSLGLGTGNSDKVSIGTDGSVQFKTVVAFASLAACNAGNEGLMQPISDSNSAVFNNAMAGGGANHILAYCDGTSWRVH